jgi:hypothetical protein
MRAPTPTTQAAASCQRREPAALSFTPGRYGPLSPNSPPNQVTPAASGGDFRGGHLPSRVHRAVGRRRRWPLPFVTPGDRPCAVETGRTQSAAQVLQGRCRTGSPVTGGVARDGQPDHVAHPIPHLRADSACDVPSSQAVKIRTWRDELAPPRCPGRSRTGSESGAALAAAPVPRRSPSAGSCPG